MLPAAFLRLARDTDTPVRRATAAWRTLNVEKERLSVVLGAGFLGQLPALAACAVSFFGSKVEDENVRRIAAGGAEREDTAETMREAMLRIVALPGVLIWIWGSVRISMDCRGLSHRGLGGRWGAERWRWRSGGWEGSGRG